MTQAAILLFSESNSRFLCEVPAEKCRELEAALGDIPFARIGETVETSRFQVAGLGDSGAVLEARLHDLKEAWQSPLRW
jgi:phosphoribosylformylglycinamidine synthase